MENVGHFPAIGPFATVRLVLGIMLGLAIFLAGLPGTRAQGAGLVDDTTYVTATDQTITWSPPWNVDEERESRTADYDAVVLDHDASVVTIVAGDVIPLSSRLAVIDYVGGDSDGAMLLESGSDGSLSWWVDLFALNGTAYGAFSLALLGPGSAAATMTVFLSPVLSFADSMSQAQAGIMIDGAPVLEGVDGLGLQDRLEANMAALPVAPGGDDGILPSLPSTPIALPVATVPENGGASGSTSSPDTAVEASVPEASASTEYADAGMVGEGHYVSPQFGTVVRWDESWILDPYREPPVDSAPEFRSDRADIAWVEDDSVMVGIWVFDPDAPPYAPDGMRMEEFIAYWSSDEALARHYSTGVEVVQASASGDKGAIVYRATTLTPVIYYTEFHMINDGTAIAAFEFIAFEPSVPLGLRAAQEHITVNGEPILTYYTVDEVLAEPTE